MDALCWIDIETTGLDPDKGFILETCIVITDEHLDIIGQPIIKRGCLEGNSVGEIRSRFADEFVQNMHDKNGLWNDLMIDYDNLPDTWDKFDLSLFDSIKNIKDSFGIDILYPAGSSVHFDIDWLRQLAEKTCTLFSHRHLDVSSLKLAQWCSTGVYNKSATDSVHRALPDVMASLNWLREYIRPASDISTLATHLHKMSEDY